MEVDVVEVETSRDRLLRAIDARRSGIEHYLAAKRPVSNRLTTISVVSSCIAAALATGPAVGGDDFATTVQKGLELGQSQAVWRLLCLAAVVAAITAAISANLSRSSDLTARIAAVEAANSLLDGLSARVRFSRLPVADAAQQYQEIIARVPWISEFDENAPGPNGDGESQQSRPTVTPAPYLIGTAAFAASFAVIATVGLVAGLIRTAPAPTSPPVTAGTATAPSTNDTAPSVEPVAHEVYSGRTTQGQTSVAIVLDGGRATAYLCDGDAVEAWFEGAVENGGVNLAGRDGATLIARSDGGSLTGSASAGGQTIGFSIPLAAPPAGVYEARVNVKGIDVRIGWAVLTDGTSIGIQDRDGQRTAAPPLALPGATFEFAGTPRAATLIDGDGDVVAEG